MPKLEIGMLNKVKNGFTLIEILVVLVIIGLTLSFAVLAFGDFGASRKIKVAAEEFVNYLQLIRQRAILESGTFGITLNGKSYQVVRFIPPNRWENLPTKGSFHSHTFPDSAQVALDSSRQTNPVIIINSSGDLTPFTLYFSTSTQKNLIAVKGNHQGQFQLEYAHEK